MTYPFIIAEMSGNHNKSLERALKIIDAAADAGASAIKIQTYTADTLTIKGVFKITEKSSLWYGKDLHDLYDEAHTPWEWHKAIFDHADKRGIICFSSPFDETAVDFLENLNVPAYKIASFENIHLPLIRKVAATGKPLIISTGMANIAELHEAVTAAREAGCKNLVLLKCTSTYPAVPVNSNIATIPHMRELFQCQVGLSDHTMGIEVPIAAVALGAVLIEKHFTLDRNMVGPDHLASLTPEELKQMVISIRNIQLAISGNGIKEASYSEKKNINIARKSIHIKNDLESGHIIKKDDLIMKRPGDGISPMQIDQIIGSKTLSDLKKDYKLTYKEIKI